MQQLSFFEEEGQSPDLPPGLVDYIPGMFTPVQSALFMNKFIKEAPWHQYTMPMYDKEVLSPRMIAWYGDTNNTVITGRIKDMLPFTPDLLIIKDRVEAQAGTHFDSVLLNYYRDGNDSVAWHSDKESTRLKDVIVASVTFGQVRSFDIRDKQDHTRKFSIRLQNGSYLLMKAGFQQRYEHRIAKSSGHMLPRINLTFRQIG